MNFNETIDVVGKAADVFGVVVIAGGLVSYRGATSFVAEARRSTPTEAIGRRSGE